MKDLKLILCFIGMLFLMLMIRAALQGARK